VNGVRRAIAVAAAVLVAVGACGRGGGASLSVGSPAFGDGRRIPLRYSCEGENVPPPLRWSGVPAEAREVAVVLLDPDAPKGTFVHWVVTGLGAGPTGELPDGGPLPPGAAQHATSAAQAGYVGPCPPDNGGVHHYVFEVMALRSHVELPASGVSPLKEVARLRRAAAARGRYRGTFER
jgi:Raf kinase inhibitor-like YbhB/YbcL family protein